MEKIFISVTCVIFFVFIFGTISMRIISLSGENYKKENRWKLRLLMVAALLSMLMFICMIVIL